MKSLRYILLLCLLFFVSCSKKTIDASSEEAMKESIEELKKDLSKEEKEKFESSLLLVALSGDNLFELSADSEATKRRMQDRLDGKTAQEVIAEGEKIKLEREAKQKKAEIERQKREEQRLAEEKQRQKEREAKEQEQIVTEINELEKKKGIATEASKKLKKFKVKSSKFYFQKSSYSTKPVIELSVSNGLDIPVASVHFDAVLATPGRSTPWVDEGFNYSISGGLEPGEEAIWKLAPNMFGEWGKAPKDRNDMVLTLTVAKIKNHKGESLLDGTFSEYDQKRLDELYKQKK